MDEIISTCIIAVAPAAILRLRLRRIDAARSFIDRAGVEIASTGGFINITVARHVTLPSSRRSGVSVAHAIRSLGGGGGGRGGGEGRTTLGMDGWTSVVARDVRHPVKLLKRRNDERGNLLIQSRRFCTTRIGHPTGIPAVG